MYNFATLDPRNVPAALEANDKVFAAGQVYGIEVTVLALAKRCIANIDPQHTGNDASRAAIEDAVTAELPPEGTTLATVRADLDAVGAMAVLAMRARGVWPVVFTGPHGDCAVCGEADVGMNHICPMKTPDERLTLVAAADKFARGGYSGLKPLPTRDNPWSEETASAEGSRPLAAIAAAVMDFKIPLADRVAVMERWLLTGDEPAQYRASVEKERLDMIAAIENGTIKSETRAGGKIAVVESAHRAATSVGYSLAPVVVALNPTFKQGPGDAYKKFTICAFEAKFADIKSALAELAMLEAGWGGSPTIGGSPQGVSSTLTIDQVVEVVERHLKG